MRLDRIALYRSLFGVLRPANHSAAATDSICRSILHNQRSPVEAMVFDIDESGSRTLDGWEIDKGESMNGRYRSLR